MDCRQPASSSIVCCKAGDGSKLLHKGSWAAHLVKDSYVQFVDGSMMPLSLTVNDHDSQRMHLQEAQANHLQKELSDGLLCAVINNNTRCYNESTEFADHLDDALAGPYKVRSSIVFSLLVSKNDMHHPDLAPSIGADHVQAKNVSALQCLLIWGGQKFSSSSAANSHMQGHMLRTEVTGAS